MRDLLSIAYIRVALIALAVVVLAGTARLGMHKWHAKQVSAERTPAEKILFVGNSLSAPIPDLLRRLALSAGVVMEASGVTPGGAAFGDHVASVQTLNAMASHHWTIIVLQEQGQRPSFAEANREQFMYPPGVQLVEVVRRAGATPWLYSHYARQAGDLPGVAGDSYAAMQSRIDDGYHRLALRTSVQVVPVGAAWHAARERVPAVPLWNPDGVHATGAGNYLVACVFLGALLHVDPTAVPDDGGLNAEAARQLRVVAKEAVRREQLIGN